MGRVCGWRCVVWLAVFEYASHSLPTPSEETASIATWESHVSQYTMKLSLGGKATVLTTGGLGSSGSVVIEIAGSPPASSGPDISSHCGSPKSAGLLIELRPAP